LLISHTISAIGSRDYANFFQCNYYSVIQHLLGVNHTRFERLPGFLFLYTMRPKKQFSIEYRVQNIMHHKQMAAIQWTNLTFGAL